MKIVVCVKQVPGIAEVRVNPDTGTLVRDGVVATLNPFCEYALDHAVRLKSDRPGTEIIAVSMGPPQARTALLRCLELGADRAVLVSDALFAGADTWATAWTLSAAIRKSAPDADLILVGKHAIDGDTAQVGPEIAEILGIAQVTCGVEIRCVDKGRRIHVKREIDTGSELIESRMPALVSMGRGAPIRRIPSFAQVLDARRKPFVRMGAAELGLPESELGLRGSFTQVVRIFPPAARRAGVKRQGLDAEAAAQAIAAVLQDKRLNEGSV